MSEARLTIQGIAELKDALARLPTELKGQATGFVVEAAYAAQRDIVAQYPVGPGNARTGYKGGKLQKGVKVTVKEIGPFKVAAQVRSTAPHGWLYEHGTQVRTYRGANRGSMPPHYVFIPTMIRHRRALYGQLATIIREHGLTVTLEG
jgi:hypothetical protein